MKMVLRILAAAVFLFSNINTFSQTKLDSILPIRGLCIGAPKPAGVDSFVVFINNELGPRKVNTIVLRVDYAYQFESHPELRDSIALSKKDVKKIVAVCKKNNIRIIPQINLIGHQSDGSKLNKLLTHYPEFDETPYIKMPEIYIWPNDDELYCKSYCPLHPDIHKIIFSLIDEITDVFETDAFHAGMDEIFYLGDSKCPRCSGKDNSELFAGEVNKIYNHLAKTNKELWIWGDRLLDGKATGIGIWEASYNNTHRAIDMIPKDIVICDWHYERPDKTAVYFAMKGFRVVTCPWRRPSVTIDQLHDMISFKNGSTKEMQPNFYGMVQTEWSGADNFMKDFYKLKTGVKEDLNPACKTFSELFNAINALK